MDQCYESGNDSFCRLISRRPQAASPASAGSVQLITYGLVNSGGAFAEGIDMTAGYIWDISDGEYGTLNLSFSWTHLLDQGFIPQIGAAVDNRAGEVGYPENKWVLRANYEYGPWAITFTNEYVGESYIDDQFLYSRFGDDTNVKDSYFAFDARYYSNLQVKYRWEDTYQFYAGINNLWDEQPPMILAGIPGNRNANYDIIGRYWYLGIRAEF
jgi:outer membrane receptor protein involved in Fe transport